MSVPQTPPPILDSPLLEHLWRLTYWLYLNPLPDRYTIASSLQYLLTNKVIGADTEWSIEDLRMYMIRTPPGYSFVLLAKGKVILGARPEPERNEAYVAFRDIVEKKMGLHVLAEQRKKESKVVDMAM